jgi:5-oxoprolinase (ATP-hydrolysing) subunit C
MGLIVIDSGFWTTVQDAGRVGYREWGVPPGGAFDRGSADLANGLVGNGPDCATLELTMRGGTFEALGNVGLGLAGAPMEASIVGTANPPWLLRMPLSFTLAAGERLVLGRIVEGARTYLAVSGGFQTRLRMGSRSTEEPLKRGDFLATSESTIAIRRPSEPIWHRPAAWPIRIVDGPDVRHLADDAFWTNGRFRVSSQSNRMGLKIEGSPLDLAAEADRLSTPVAPGAIQVAGRQLIILGVASGTMGGYPHIANVITADLDRVGQLRPGDEIRFERVSIEQARDLDRAMRNSRRALLLQVASLARDSSSPVVRSN